MHKLKNTLEQGNTAYGIFSALKDPAVVEIAGNAGYDFFVIDLEHSTLDLSTMEHMVRAAEVSNITSIVRTPQEDYGTILRVVESGADAVMVPHLITKEQAEKIVGIAKYQPIGNRGVDASTRVAKFAGGSSVIEHMKQQNERVLVIGMIEDAEAVENIDEIVSVQGLDVLFIGPSDLAASYGLPGQVTHSTVRNAIKKVIKRSNQSKIKVGMPAFEKDQIQAAVDMGASLITTPPVDASYLHQMLKKHLTQVRI